VDLSVLAAQETPMIEQPDRHPVVACAAELLAAIKTVRDVQPVFMTAADQQTAVLELDRAAAALAELQLRVMAAAGAAAEEAGARDVGAWVASLTHADFGPARADARLAEGLDLRWAAVAAGMADGVVSAAQARVVVEALEALPDDLDPSIVAEAELDLVELCTQFPPAQLRRLGRRILDVVAPDIADAEEAKRLENEEQRAREKTSLRIKRLGDGTTRTTILQPDADADRLLTYLDAYTSPRHDLGTLGGEADRIPHHRKRGHAFGALLEHLDPTRLPAHGGDATTVMVTVSLDALTQELATAGIIDGDLSAGANLTAAQARRLACTANIIPVVLGGKSEILDLGHARRLYSPSQRKAIRLRDQRCRAEGCSIPAPWTEAHHWKPWSEGGPTDLDNAASLCNWHHHRIHDRRFDADRLANGDIRFHRRRQTTLSPRETRTIATE
jgi:hypothetical protein